MRLNTWARFGVALLVFCLPLIRVHAALPGDEDRLRRGGVQTDTRSLIAFLHGQTIPPPGAIPDLIRKLGSEEFSQREKAEQALRDIGEAALPALKKASADPDPEIARRARDCVEAMTYAVSVRPEQSLLAVRVLLRRAPPGVIAALVEYLPFAPSTEVDEAIWFGLDALVAREGSWTPPLRQH